MIASSCRNLSRIELVYTVNAHFIKKLDKIDKALIPEECLVYLEKVIKMKPSTKPEIKAQNQIGILLKQSNTIWCCFRS